jgi:hypothetical protein
MKKTYRTSNTFSITNASGKLAEGQHLFSSWGSIDAIITGLDNNEDYSVKAIRSCKLRTLTYGQESHTFQLVLVKVDETVTVTLTESLNQTISEILNEMLDRDFSFKELSNKFTKIGGTLASMLFSTSGEADITAVCKKILRRLKTHTPGTGEQVYLPIGILQTNDNGNNHICGSTLVIDYDVSFGVPGVL